MKCLKKVDPESAEQIHFHNIKRVIRALEYYQQTGQKISEHNEAERKKESAYNSAYFVLTDDRKILYDRIDKRVDLMMQEGLLEEVNALRLRGLKRESVAMQDLDTKNCLAILKESILWKKPPYHEKRNIFSKRTGLKI